MESLVSQHTQDEVNLYFVLAKGTTESSCSEKLAASFQACQDVGFPCQWLAEEEVVKMQPGKQDVYVCDPFQGAAFEHLASGKFKSVRLLGPQCLLTCLSKSEPVPELPYPLYTAAMRGLVVTSTGFNKQEKARVQRLVQQMSGVYSSDFHEGVTHLVAGVVASAKYQVAVGRDVPVMCLRWVERVWELSCQQSILATDPQFSDLTCPPFQGLYICVSQLSRRDKEAIRKIIENNGGHYMAQLECDKTSLLVTPSEEGEKATFARRWQIPCVVPEWLYDSVERTVCLPMEDYNTGTRAKLSSTPIKNHTQACAAGLGDLTTSTIHCPNESRLRQVDETSVNETALSASAAAAEPAARGSSANAGEELASLDRIDMQEVAAAGQFLEGCKIHLYGFDGRRAEKLRRMLKTSGAMRFSQLLPSVTHVVLSCGPGRPAPGELVEQVSGWRPQLVSVSWLLACCRAGRPVNERPHQLETVLPTDPAGEASQQAAVVPAGPAASERPGQASQQGTVLAAKQQPLQPAQASQQLTAPRDGETAEESALEDTQTLFSGLQFHVSAELDERTRQQVLEILAEHGGRVVTSPLRPGQLGYTVAPLILQDSELTGTDTDPSQLVTLAFLQHCLELDQLQEPEYFHRPIRVVSGQALAGCVIGISSYSGRERQYLALLAESMGAEFQEVFARRDNPAKYARASTHLVCQSAEGHKYRAARKWGLPTVSRDWLLGCAAAGRRLPTEPCTVGCPAAGETLVSSSGAAPPTEPGSAALPSYRLPPAALTPVRPPRLPAPAPGSAQMDTPRTPYGRPFTADGQPDSETRKFWKRYIDAMEETPEVKRRRVSTPLSQLVLKFFDGLPKDGAAAGVEQKVSRAPDEPDTPATARLVQAELREAAADVTSESDVTRQLAELNQLVSRRSGSTSAVCQPSTPAAVPAEQASRIPSLAEPPGTQPDSVPNAHEVNTQGTAITWDDPCERQARNNLMSEETSPLGSPAGGQQPPPVNRRPVFIFSGVEQAERVRWTSVVQQLGGTVSDSAVLDPAATHLLTSRPNRSEKHLAAVASGRWLLHPTYLSASQRAGHFLQEERYEWGCPELLASTGLSEESIEYRLATSARRWRLRIEQDGVPGVFHSMTAVLVTSAERSRAFQRLISAGGGRTVPLQELESKPVTHVFVEPGRADRSQLTPALWRRLAGLRLPCLQPVYLNECLTSDQDQQPSPDRWLVEEYRRLAEPS